MKHLLIAFALAASALSAEELTVTAVPKWTIVNSSGTKGKWEIHNRTLKDRWEVIVKIPLKTINANNSKGNLLNGLILRERHAHGSDKQREYSSWDGGNHHRTMTFGTIKQMR